ncbi:MAG: N-acetylmuramoyl-L-alanine amidase family protein [Actinomycetota bacterium]
MSFADPRRLEWMMAAVAVVILALATILVTASRGAPEPASVRVAAAVQTPAPKPTPGKPVRVGFDIAEAGAATTKVTTAVYQEPSAASPVVSRLRPGIVLPVFRHEGPYLRVMTPCEAKGWVKTTNVLLHPKAHGPPKSLADAIIVIDPGHGGMQPGARGPNGLAEKDANLAIARRVAGGLRGTRVYLTRYLDFTAGLVYRTSLASTLGAHALVSVHNNSIPDGPSSRPGSETWHQSRSGASQRLSTLVLGELVEALKSFEINWVSDRDAGTRTRLNHEGHDFYGLLRGSKVPTVIVEAMFISNGPEADLLTKAEGQDAVAKALARSLKRYVKESGHDVSEPYSAAAGTAGGVPVGCVDPA